MPKPSKLRMNCIICDRRLRTCVKPANSTAQNDCNAGPRNSSNNIQNRNAAGMNSPANPATSIG